MLLISFDTSVLPFLGIWLCYGGPGEARIQQYAVALEPTTSPHNTLASAQREGVDLLLQPGGVSSWEIYFRISDPRNDLYGFSS
jgi:hypothetical protein